MRVNIISVDSLEQITRRWMFMEEPEAKPKTLYLWATEGIFCWGNKVYEIVGTDTTEGAKKTSESFDVLYRPLTPILMIL